MRIFASFSKIFTAQYAENSGAVRGVLGVEASAGHPSRPKAGLPGTPDYGRGKMFPLQVLRFSAGGRGSRFSRRFADEKGKSSGHGDRPARTGLSKM
jgi:hypothetical protein